MTRPLADPAFASTKPGLRHLKAEETSPTEGKRLDVPKNMEWEEMRLRQRT